MAGFIEGKKLVGDDTYHNIRAYDRETMTFPKEGMFSQHSAATPDSQLKPSNKRSHYEAVGDIDGLSDDHPRKLVLRSLVEKMGQHTSNVYKEWSDQTKMAENDIRVCEQVGFNYKHFIIFGHGFSYMTTPLMESLPFARNTMLHMPQPGQKVRVLSTITDYINDDDQKSFCQQLLTPIDENLTRITKFPNLTGITNFPNNDKYQKLNIDFDMYSDIKGRESYNLGIYDMEFIWEQYNAFKAQLNKVGAFVEDKDLLHNFPLKITFSYKNDGRYGGWHPENFIELNPIDSDGFDEDKKGELYQAYFLHIFFNLLTNKDKTKKMYHSGPRFVDGVDTRIKYIAPKIKIRVEWGAGEFTTEWDPIQNYRELLGSKINRELLGSKINRETNLSEVFAKIKESLDVEETTRKERKEEEREEKLLGLKIDVFICNLSTESYQKTADRKEADRIRFVHSVASSPEPYTNYFVNFEEVVGTGGGVIGNLLKTKRKRTRGRKKRSVKRNKRTRRRKKRSVKRKKRTRRRKKRKRKKRTRKRRKVMQ